MPNSSKIVKPVARPCCFHRDICNSATLRSVSQELRTKTILQLLAINNWALLALPLDSDSIDF